MARGGQTRSGSPLGGLLGIVRDVRLAWQLFRDERVPVWIKSVPILSLAYLIWPLDLLADPLLGLGQLDDLAVLALGIKLFISLCAPDLVQQYRERGWHHAREPNLMGSAEPGLSNSKVIDTTYRVLDENEASSPKL